MQAVFRSLLESRSAWIGVATTVLTGALLKYGTSLGLTEVQAQQIATAALVIALAIIGKLAVQNVTAIAKGTDN
jgi:hypothetical protein